MEKRANSIFGFILILVAGACVGNTVPKPVVLEETPDFATYSAMQRDRPESSGNADDEDKQEVRKMTTDIFAPLWSPDYPVYLAPEDDNNDLIIPTFASAEIEHEFLSFFIQRNLRIFIDENPGKGVYCECVGEHYEINGTKYYKIYKVRFFAKQIPW